MDEAFTLKGTGCRSVYDVIRKYKSQLRGKPSEWVLPKGNGHGEVLLREVILKAQNKWDFPYKEEELCHCRMVPTEVVDRIVKLGTDHVEEVARKTTAGTGCGTCRPITEEIIKYRKGA